MNRQSKPIGEIIFAAGLIIAIFSLITMRLHAPVVMIMFYAGVSLLVVGLILTIILRLLQKKRLEIRLTIPMTPLSYNLQFAGIGLFLVMIALTLLPSTVRAARDYSRAYLIPLIIGGPGAILVLYGIVRIVIVMIKGEEKRWKAIIGWISYFIGVFLCTAPLSYETRFFTWDFTAGVVLTAFGLYLIILDIREISSAGLVRARQYLNRIGTLVFIPCCFSFNFLYFYSTVRDIAFIGILAAGLLYLTSLILKVLTPENKK